jgi:hypothetical protein
MPVTYPAPSQSVHLVVTTPARRPISSSFPLLNHWASALKSGEQLISHGVTVATWVSSRDAVVRGRID